MNILVTGYKGFIGKHVVHRLTQSGHRVIGWDWGDQNWDDTDLFLNLDHVIHLGAITATTSTDVHAIITQNYLYTKKLVDMCSSFNIPISIASSASVYGTGNTTFKETDTPAPANAYAWSKYMVEEYCMSRDFSIPIHLFRYFNVYGPGEGHKGDQASPYHKFTDQAVKTGMIRVFEGSVNFRRDFVPVDYVATIHGKFLNCTQSGIWNLGTGTAVSFMDVARSIAHKFDATIVEIPMPDSLRLHYQTYTQACTDKLLATLTQLEKGPYGKET